MFSRRDMLTVSAAGAVMTASAARAASFGNPDLPPQGADVIADQRGIMPVRRVSRDGHVRARPGQRPRRRRADP